MTGRSSDAHNGYISYQTFKCRKKHPKRCNGSRVMPGDKEAKSTQARAFDQGWQLDRPCLAFEEGSDGKDMFCSWCRQYTERFKTY